MASCMNIIYSSDSAANTISFSPQSDLILTHYLVYNVRSIDILTVIIFILPVPHIQTGLEGNGFNCDPYK